MFKTYFFAALVGLGAPVLAQGSPVGLWQSVDDTTGQPRAEIRIAEAGGVLTGRIERSLLPTPAGTVQLCRLCPDDRKDQPLLGMVIIRNMTPGEDALTWVGGEILDPDKGKLFKLRLQLQDGGTRLQVRGYIGPFFRNQTWKRLS
jgi:uncharacterized protein (DUF2147 family)